MVPRDMPPDPELPDVTPDGMPGSNSVAASTPSDADSPSRRRFLKGSAAAAGSSLLGGCLDGDPVPTTFRLGGAAFDTFDHTIVVMFENRSLDSLLGFLYPTGTVPRDQTYNGLADGEHQCPVPPYINEGHAFVSARISPGTDADMMNQNPDPGASTTTRRKSCRWTTPRAASTWPVTLPRPVPPELSETNPLAAGLAPRPLNDLEQALGALTMAYFQVAESAAIPKTQADAYTLLQQLAQGRFGK